MPSRNTQNLRDENNYKEIRRKAFLLLYDGFLRVVHYVYAVISCRY